MTPASLSIFSAIEFCLWDAQDDSTNFQRNFNIGEVEVEDEVIYHKTEYRERRDHFAYFACSAKSAGFDTQRDTFLGRYRGWDNPAVVECGESANSIAHGWAPIASKHVKLNLKPGESQQIVFILGYQENPKDQKFDPPNSQIINKKSAKATIAKYLSSANADAAFEKLAPILGERARHPSGGDARPAHQPYGEHLERLPMHGDVQYVALGVVL